MIGSRILPRRNRAPFSKGVSREVRLLLRDERGSALLEFAVTLPLLVVFVVGIYDFSGACNQKQKIDQAAQEGAIIVGAQPLSDIAAGSTGIPTNPDSLQPVVTAIFNSLASSGVLNNANQASCKPPFVPFAQAGLTWTYQIPNCNGAHLSDNLTIIINRGCLCVSGATCTATPCAGAGPPIAVDSMVTVQYPYHWQFNSVIQSLIPGANYAALTTLSESSTTHNQM